MIDPTVVQDQLTRSLEFWERGGAKGALTLPPREALMGLRYAPGERVVDSTTGKEVEVLGGARTIIAVPSPGSEGSESLRRPG